MRWLIAQLINKYLALTIRVITAISIKDAPAAIKVNPAYSPADALHSRLVRKDWAAFSPAFFAAMPREKEC